MTELADTDDSADVPSAGAMLRAAREKKGLHIAALAASIKVSPRKLDALENDRHDELPGLTFTRALAQTVCRSLKIDPEPILGRLPQSTVFQDLAQIGPGINSPFREKPGRLGPSQPLLRRSPLFWAALVVVLAAAALWVVPQSFIGSLTDRVLGAAKTGVRTSDTVLGSPMQVPVPSGVASSPLAAATTPQTVVEIVHAAPQPAAASASMPAAAEPAGSGAVLVVRVAGESWVEVVDGGGRSLISRTLLAGETVNLDGKMPMRVKVGNAQTTRLILRGKSVDLAPSTRDNVARLELK